jgi:hypothetical protein
MQKPWKKEEEEKEEEEGAAVAGAQTSCYNHVATGARTHGIIITNACCSSKQKKTTQNHEGNIRGVLSTIRVHELHELLQQAFLPSPHPH